MVKKKLLKQIKDDFIEISFYKKIKGILLFGSYANDQETTQSDIDICIVAPDEDKFELHSYFLGKINTVTKKYDIRFFSELPIYIKIHVIEDGILLYSPNELDLYEYFYFFRKLWDDQKNRQELTREELFSLLD